MPPGLGPLEMQVLGLLDTEAEQSVQEVRARLGEQGRRVAYTTVMTVLSRLHEKRLVRRRKHGNRYVYRAGRGSEQVKGGILRRVQRALFSDRLQPIAALIDQDLDRAELEALRRLIDDKLEQEP